MNFPGNRTRHLGFTLWDFTTGVKNRFWTNRHWAGSGDKNDAHGGATRPATEGRGVFSQIENTGETPIVFLGNSFDSHGSYPKKIGELIRIDENTSIYGGGYDALDSLLVVVRCSMNKSETNQKSISG